MDGETILTWNATNWITVILMAILGFAVLSIVGQIWQKRNSQNGG